MVYDLQTVQRIAAKHGLPGEAHVMPNCGMVNEAWAIGEDYVLRITKAKDCEDEAEREALVVPLLVDAGVRTPELVAWSKDAELVPMPYTVYRRASGTMVGGWDRDPADFEDLYEDLGRELALIHSLSLPNAARQALTRDRTWNVPKRVEKAVAKGKLAREEADDIHELREWLEPRRGAPKEKTLIHLDVHPWNLMADSEQGRLTAVLDWGDCCVHDPAIDFASMPLLAMEPMFRGYREAGGQVDGGFLARAILHSVDLACFEIVDLDPALYRRQWWRMPAGGWPEMKGFLSNTWPELVPARWRSASV